MAAPCRAKWRPVCRALQGHPITAWRQCSPINPYLNFQHTYTPYPAQITVPAQKEVQGLREDDFIWIGPRRVYELLTH